MCSKPWVIGPRWAARTFTRNPNPNILLLSSPNLGKKPPPQTPGARDWGEGGGVKRQRPH